MCPQHTRSVCARPSGGRSAVSQSLRVYRVPGRKSSCIYDDKMIPANLQGCWVCIPWGENSSYGRDSSRPYERSSSISPWFHPQGRRPGCSAACREMRRLSSLGENDYEVFYTVQIADCYYARTHRTCHSSILQRGKLISTPGS